jgi:hypothetical protein
VAAPAPLAHMPFIDSAVLDLTEWLCRRFQVLTGRTNIWVAFQLTNLSVVLYFIAAGLYFVTTGDLFTRIALALFCGGLLYLLTQTVFKEPIDLYEKAAYQRVARGLRNPRRIRDSLLRVLFLTLSLLLLSPTAFVYVYYDRPSVVPLTYSLIVLTTIVLYLLACDPLPPCAGTIREWLRGLVPARAVRAPDRA